MTPKPGQAGTSESSSPTTTRKGASAEMSYDDDAPGAVKGSPAPSELESKLNALTALQAQEKQLTNEIANLRALQTDLSTFAGQLKANADAIDRDRNDLQTFVTNELKAIDPKTKAAIISATKDTDAGIAKARSEWEDAVKKIKTASDAVDASTADLNAATAAFVKAKQGIADAKRALGDLKTIKKDVQTAEGRNEFAIAGYWLLELERRLPEAELPDEAAVKAAWDDLGRKRTAAETAKRDADAAKADEATRRKARDEAEKNRESVILERLKSQTEAQKPETAA